MRLWTADCGRDGCRRARGEPGGPRSDSLKLCLCWWFDETRRWFRAEGERDSVLDRGEAMDALLREVSDPWRECKRSAISEIVGSLAKDKGHQYVDVEVDPTEVIR